MIITTKSLLLPRREQPPCAARRPRLEAGALFGVPEVPVESGDIGVTVREEVHEHCEGLSASERRVVDNLEAFLPELLWDLEDPTTTVEL